MSAHVYCSLFIQSCFVHCVVGCFTLFMRGQVEEDCCLLACFSFKVIMCVCICGGKRGGGGGVVCFCFKGGCFCFFLI